MIGEAIIILLHASTVLNGLIGSRIRPNVVTPDDIMPAIYVADYRMERMGCDAVSGPYNGVIEIGVFSKDYGVTVKVVKEVRKILDDYSGFVTLLTGGEVGLTMVKAGEQSPDDYDETGTVNIKVIEYEAYAQIRA